MDAAIYLRHYESRLLRTLVLRTCRARGCSGGNNGVFHRAERWPIDYRRVETDAGAERAPLRYRAFDG